MVHWWKICDSMQSTNSSIIPNIPNIREAVTRKGKIGKIQPDCKMYENSKKGCLFALQ